MIQVLMVRKDTGVLTDVAVIPQWEVSGSGSGCQSEYRSGDL